MARAYSDDLRRKVLLAYGAGKGTMNELAERFGVSYGWVRKIAASERRTGSVARVPQRRAASRIDSSLVQRLVAAQPDAVLAELRERMQVHGVRISTTHLWRVLQKAGLGLKKSRSTPPSATQKKAAAVARSSSRPSARSRRKT